LAGFGVEVCAIQLPGRENRLAEPTIDSLPQLVDALADELASWFDLPFAFFGHSMGALLCFELTRELRRRGRALPVHLFVSGARAPDVSREEYQLHQIADDSEFIEQVAGRYNGIPDAVLRERELLDLLLPALRADFAAFEKYQYTEEPPIAVRMTALGGSEDHLVHDRELAAWQPHTREELTIERFPGDHFFLHQSRARIIEAIVCRLSNDAIVRPGFEQFK
jgi:surfactin synthase thioesterase subunit